MEAPKRNLLSLPSQTWRDSPTSNFDGDGRMANTADPVAHLDIQMLAMDALKSAAALLWFVFRTREPRDLEIAGNGEAKRRDRSARNG